MDRELERLAEQVFHRAIELPQPERQAYVQQGCGQNAKLRAKVDALLAADAAADASKARAAPGTTSAGASLLFGNAGDSTTWKSTYSEHPGEIIGRYKLLEKIGEGGFGVVWMAEQREPVKRRVALKVIKLGMDTREVVARFEQERQALALMDHPNIAKVLDGGATEQGRPYFVMELVRGIPITDFCDKERLDTKRRLELFAQVCNAVQHAHTKGIIHRDIKPSNVLVTLHDGVPVPKVIDFGIAKATNAELTEKTLFTQHRQMIGTPAYMSPEQAEMSGLDIDTRSDVYSLGVLLYELLTGTPPFDPQKLRSAGYAEMVRIIREEEPPKPSLRLSSLGDRLTSVSRSRQIDAGKLRALMRGDLDWIVMKCLEKDRTRRYETTSALAADVQRHLVGDPVVAAPPSRLYRLSKTLRRHRTAAVVTTSFVILIAAGLVATGALWRQAAHARDAESDQRARAEAINTFLKDMLTAADPAKAKGAKLTVSEALTAAAERIDSGVLRNQPLVEADLRATIGATYLSLSLYPQAAAQLRAAESIQVRELGNDHSDTLRTRTRIGETLYRDSDYAGAAAVLEPTLPALRRVLGPENPETLHAMVVLGMTLGELARFPENEALLLAAIEGRRRVLGANHPDTADAMDELGEAYTFHALAHKAEPLHREALRIHSQALGEEHVRTLNSIDRLAGSLYNQNRSQEAEPLYRRVLELRQRVLGPDHILTLATQIGFGAALTRLGRYTEAETALREAMERQTRVFPSHVNTIQAQRFLAVTLVSQMRYEEAEILLRDALRAAREAFGPGHYDTTVRLMCALASVLATQQKDVEAEQVARDVFELQRRMQTPNVAEVQQSLGALRQALHRQGKTDEALRYGRELLNVLVRAASEANAAASASNLAAWDLLTIEEAELRDPRKALELAQRAAEQTHYSDPAILDTLALAFHRTGDTTKAIELQKRALSLLAANAPDRAGYEQQLAEFERALDAKPGSVDP